MQTNRKMLVAQSGKFDCFYTKYETIEKELPYYRAFLKGKKIYCCCDDPDSSNFFKYLKDKFDDFELSSLVSTFYTENGHSFRTEMFRKNGKPCILRTRLKGNGDFRSEECLSIMRETDIVITNPPFSLTKELIPLLYKYKKQFLILGNQNTLTFRDVYPKALSGEIRFGVSIHSGDIEFEIPDSYPLDGLNAKMENGKKYARVTGIRWFTNMDHNVKVSPIKLHSKRWNLKNNPKLARKLHLSYGTDSYPYYDNYPGIEVPFTSAIPCDFRGVFGVPVTFFDYYDPEIFEIVGFRKGTDGKDLRINGKTPYFRFLVKFRTTIRKYG